MRPVGDPQEGISMVFDDQGRWPDFTPRGWDGPIQYTIWACKNVGGQWYCSGFIQMWRTRPSTGAPLLSPTGYGQNWTQNWAYGPWGPMNTPAKEGEEMVFGATAGNGRFETVQTSYAERTNFVSAILKSGDNWTIDFSAGIQPLHASLGFLSPEQVANNAKMLAEVLSHGGK